MNFEYIPAFLPVMLLLACAASRGRLYSLAEVEIKVESFKESIIYR